MGSRYLVTGTELAIIKTLAKNDPDKIKETVDKILEKQYVGNSLNAISEDALIMREGKLPLFTSRYLFTSR